MLFKLRRFIICTPAKPGVLVSNLNQKLNAPFIFVFILFGLFTLANQNNFLIIEKAQAASVIPANLEVAREVFENISPIIKNDVPESVVSASFTPEGYLPKPLTPDTQVTKDEVTPRKVLATPKKNTVSRAKTAKMTGEMEANRFPFGYCTYYVAQRRFIPWSGNAIAWLSGAQSFGYATGDTPQVGAIVVTNEGGKAGHVAYVDAVNGDQITISEMNYNGFGVVSSRTISASYGRILGYIY